MDYQLWKKNTMFQSQPRYPPTKDGTYLTGLKETMFNSPVIITIYERLFIYLEWFVYY